MISLVEGTVVERSTDRVVISANGVGYEALIAASTAGRIPKVGEHASLYTRLQIKDDSMVLYGFATADERALFDMLVKVNGVGPRYALAVLSAFAPDEFRRAVVAGDLEALTVVPGIGKKVAGRIVLDLKDKLGGDFEVAPGPLSEVREALLSLGLTPQESRDAMIGLDPAGEVEVLLRDALQNAGRS